MRNKPPLPWMSHGENFEDHPKFGTSEWRKRVADLMKEEMDEPEIFWWLSFCDPDKPRGYQFLGAIVVKAHGITDALTKCNTMMINPGGEVKGFPLPDNEEVRKRLVPEVLNRLLTVDDMIKLGWEPTSMNNQDEGKQ